MDLPAFWNDKHQAGDRHWLTGTSMGMIYRFYDIGPDDLKSRKILEIGVGVGAITKELRQLADKLYCSDISAVALKNVGQYADGTFLSPDISQAPAVDVAICHLVLVHCNDDEVRRILSSINLTPGGKIYCQFSCLKTPDAVETAPPAAKKSLTELGPHHFRTPSDIERIIQDSGLSISRDRNIDPGDYLGWNGQFWKLCVLERKQK